MRGAHAWLIAALSTLAAWNGDAADDRTLLNHCKQVVEQQKERHSSAANEDAELQRCWQIIREWSLRDSRMSVDEDGRPLR